MTAAGELLLDTGALVAALHRGDRDHARCVAALAGFRGTLLTTEAVLTESLYLMARVAGGQDPSTVAQPPAAKRRAIGGSTASSTSPRAAPATTSTT